MYHVGSHGREMSETDTTKQKKLGMEEFRKQRFGKDLPERGVMFPSNLSIDFWVRLSKCIECRDFHGDEAADKLARKHVKEIIQTISDNLEKYKPHVIAEAGENVDFEKALKAREGLIKALESGHSGQSAFFGMMLVANALSLGDWDRYFAYKKLGNYESNTRYSRVKSKTDGNGRYKDSDHGLILCRSFTSFCNNKNKEPTKRNLELWLKSNAGNNFQTDNGTWEWLEFDEEGSQKKGGGYYPVVRFKADKEGRIGWSSLLKRLTQAKAE